MQLRLGQVDQALTSARETHTFLQYRDHAFDKADASIIVQVAEAWASADPERADEAAEWIRGLPQSDQKVAGLIGIARGLVKSSG